KMDTGLSDSLILLRRAIPERGMQPRPVVETLDVLEHEAVRLGTRVDREVVEPLGLEGMEEALRRRVVQTIPGSAHAAHDPVMIEELLVVGASVRPAAIAVVHEPGHGPTPRDRRVQRLEGEGLLGPRR